MKTLQNDRLIVFVYVYEKDEVKNMHPVKKNLIETLSHMPIQHKTIFIQNNKHAKGRAYYELRMQKSD